MNCHNLTHSPVLQKEVLAVLLFDGVQTVFDGTLGLGGHAESILTQFPEVSQYIACDLDAQHLAFARKRLERWSVKISLHHSNFSKLTEILGSQTVQRPMVILLDLGICSNHVDDAEKGFSFQADGPLNMAFDVENTEKNAEVVLNTYPKEELIKILKLFGEEPMAQKIAQRICEYRETEALKKTGQLRSIIEGTVHAKDRNKTLMRVFQAIRIEVNDELEHLQETLQEAIEIMKSGDRMGVMSYHALEDRIVKKFFTKLCRPETVETEFSLHTEIAPAKAKSLTKKPIVPSDEEIAQNPRSRSAKFRIIEKI